MALAVFPWKKDMNEIYQEKSYLITSWPFKAIYANKCQNFKQMSFFLYIILRSPQQIYINQTVGSSMPYTFHVQIRSSQVQGKGVFALQDIPKETVIWVYQCENPLPILGHDFQKNRVFTREGLQALQHEEIKLIFHSGLYLAKFGFLVNFRDGTQFTNHSSKSNSETVIPISNDYRDLKIVSTKPIQKGEEICEEYSNLIHQTEWLTALMEKHNPDRLNFEKYILKEKLESQILDAKDQ